VPLQVTNWNISLKADDPRITQSGAAVYTFGKDAPLVLRVNVSLWPLRVSDVWPFFEDVEGWLVISYPNYTYRYQLGLSIQTLQVNRTNHYNLPMWYHNTNHMEVTVAYEIGP
jgi:hypothetical protein